MNFQKAMLLFFIIILLVCLIFIGVVLVNSKSTEQWPPLIGDCPDYWVDTSGNGSKCVNTKNLGKCNVGSDVQTMDFSVAPFTGSNGLCAKYNWANSCALTWDGITYGVPNPCDVPAPTS